jgi:hypothetical protein
MPQPIGFRAIAPLMPYSVAFLALGLVVCKMPLQHAAQRVDPSASDP